MKRLLLLLIWGTGHSCVSAQQRSNCPNLELLAVRSVECATEPPVVTGGELTRTSWLQARGISGTTRVSYTVNADGVVDPHSVRIDTTTRSAISRSFGADIKAWTFAPARQASQRVAVRLQHELTVSGFPQDWEGPPVEQVVRTVGTPTGFRTVVTHAAVGETPFESISVETLISVQNAIVAHLIGAGDYEASAAICLETAPALSSTASRTSIARARDIDSRIMGPARCPPAYTSMIQRVDSTGAPVRRPEGYVDPYWIKIERVVQWSGDWIRARVQESQSGAGTGYRCDIRYMQAAWNVACHQHYRFFSE